MLKIMGKKKKLQFFAEIFAYLLLCQKKGGGDQQPFLNQWKENDCRNYFMINLHVSMGYGSFEHPKQC